MTTRFLEDLWDAREAAALGDDPLELLRYRSNRLGDDLRITNFGGGNTSSKFSLVDPVTGRSERVLAVKGSGGDLKSISRAGFAILSLDRLEQLVDRYPGESREDEMVALYPLCAFGASRVAASIDTPLHAFLPFDHVDHLHPDWAIALAASANGRAKLDEFNARYGRHIAWVPWQRPGFELALMLRRAVTETPGCDGIILGGHGLFTWGTSQRECYLNSVTTIDQMGQFIADHRERAGRPAFGGPAVTATIDRTATALALLPFLRGVVSSNRRTVAHWDESSAALEFANSAWAADLCRLGTSCPDHFLRTRICPMFIAWNPADGAEKLRSLVTAQAATYQTDYSAYYDAFADKTSPALRDANPSVVVIAGLGVFGFAKDRREARITTEFFLNAIQVMAGANALEDAGGSAGPLPQARTPDQAVDFTSFHNYVALPRREAFRIEYWALEEAKLQRMPPEKAFSRKVALVVGAGSGIGREALLGLARGGAHVVAADRDAALAGEAAIEAGRLSSSELVLACALDLESRASVRAAIEDVILRFGGLDILINTAAIYPTPAPDTPVEDVWAKALAVNLTSNHVLAQEAGAVFKAQRLTASIVLTSSANAVVPKHGSEPYDVSKAAINHLIRELAMGLAPEVRVNGIAPATVVAGSAMFPRDRVIVSLKKYDIAFTDDETTEALRAKLAEFYARRTLTRRPIMPQHCADAILWLAGEASGRTTGHVIPVDGGLPEAFLR